MKIKALKKYKIAEDSVRWGIRVLARVNPALATKVLYRITMEEKLDLKHPEKLNEKLLFLKLNDYKDNELITTIVDKYRVREYLRSLGEKRLLNELYGVWDSVEEIDIDKLPEQFVLKCNHDSGSVVICTDKQTFDWKKEKEKLKKALKKDYWLDHAEIQYKHVKKKIICEKYLENAGGGHNRLQILLLSWRAKIPVL